MKRPSFQFYPDDWSGNSNLKRCTHEEKGIWMDVLCVLHDQDEYGVARWPLKELAVSVGCTPAKLRKLVEKGVLKGAEANETAQTFVYVPRSGRKNGPPVELIPEQKGPIWYSSRMVEDEHKRLVRGGIDEAPKGTPDASPKGGIGVGIGDYFGDDIGAASKGAPNPSLPTRARGQPPRAAPSSPSPSPIKHSSAAAASHADAPAHEGQDSPPPAPPDGQGQSEAAAPPADQTRGQAIAVWLRQAEKARGKQPTGTASSDPRIVAWAEHGITDAQLAEAYELAVADREKSEDLGPIGPGFLDIFVGKLLNPSAAASAVNKRPPASDPLFWATTWSGIVAKGAEHGLTQCEGEPEPAFKARVHAAAGLTAADKSRLLADFGVRA